MAPPVSSAAELCAAGRHQWVVVCSAPPLPCYREYDDMNCALIYCGWCEDYKHIHFPANWPDL